MKLESGDVNTVGEIVNDIELCDRCVILGNIVIHSNTGRLSKKNFSVWVKHHGKSVFTIETNHIDRKLLADVREVSAIILELNKLSQKLDG